MGKEGKTLISDKAQNVLNMLNNMPYTTKDEITDELYGLTKKTIKEVAECFGIKAEGNKSVKEYIEDIFWEHSIGKVRGL